MNNDAVLICRNGDWSLSSGSLGCTGSVIQEVSPLPEIYTGEMAVESFFYGFTTFLPVFLTVYAGRQLIKAITGRK